MNQKREKGASLIEALVAGALVASVSLVVLPIVFQSKKVARHSDFHSLCINAVRAKIAEYKYGAETDLSAVSANLTIETNTASSGGTPVSTGFSYAKARYNLENANYCPRAGAPTPETPLNVPVVPPAVLTDLGREECIQGLGPAPAGCISAFDQRMANVAPGFRLFVNLRRYNAAIPIGAGGGVPPVPLEDCPFYAGTNSYDFQNAGDGIKVTAIGLIDMARAGATAFAGIDPADVEKRKLLTCEISDIIRPFSPIARYWLQADGRIFRWLGTGTIAAGVNSYEVFQALASAGNLGIAISPDNRFAFVLRPGKIIRFSGCTGDPIDCDPSTEVSWDIDPRVISMGAKFSGFVPHKPNDVCAAPQDGLPVVFGLLSDHKTGVCIPLSTQPAGGAVAPVYDDPVGPRIPFTVVNSDRVHSIFMDPGAGSTYIVDLTCSDFLGQTYCGGIYNSNDQTMIYPLEVFSLRAIAFSK